MSQPGPLPASGHVALDPFIWPFETSGPARGRVCGRIEVISLGDVDQPGDQLVVDRPGTRSRLPAVHTCPWLKKNAQAAGGGRVEVGVVEHDVG